MDIDENTSFADGIYLCLELKNNDLMEQVLNLMWLIWYSRNQWVFQNKVIPLWQVFQRAAIPHIEPEKKRNRSATVNTQC